MIQIRTLQKSDNKVLADIIRAIFIEHDAPQEGTVYTDPTTDDLYSLFQKDNAILYVGELDGEIVGCGGIYPTESLPAKCVEFVKFYISPKGRGHKIGLQIMELSTTFAKDQGMQKIYIESLPHYAKAVSMYEKQGFNMLDKPLGQSGHTTCNIWMIKELVG